jgi:hypothetical protein
LRRNFVTTGAAALGFATTGLVAAGLLGATPDAVRVLAACVGVILAPP